jgi:hypothetical protein
MVNQGDAQPKGPCQRELINLGCLLPYQNHQWICQIANAEEEKKQNNMNFVAIIAELVYVETQKQSRKSIT